MKLARLTWDMDLDPTPRSISIGAGQANIGELVAVLQAAGAHRIEVVGLDDSWVKQQPYAEPGDSVP